MHGQGPFAEFDGWRGSPRGAGWILRTATFAVMLVVAGGIGYGLGRGTWVLPEPVAAQMPDALTRWLPPRAAGIVRGSMPVQLKDYGFELVEPQAKQGRATVAVRLVHKPAGEPVAGAVVFARRLDMAPEAMPTMTAELELQPATEPGVYRFETNLTMKGGWQLSLAAKVPGETGTVQDKLVLKAVP